MKKLFVLTAIIFAAFNVTNAQAKSESPTEQADTWVKNNNPILKLTPDQETQVKNIAVALYNMLESNKVQYADNKKAMEDANNAANNKFNFHLNQILTADQQAALNQSMKKK